LGEGVTRTFARFFFFFTTGFFVAFVVAFAVAVDVLLAVALDVALAVAFTVASAVAFTEVFTVGLGVGFFVAAWEAGAMKAREIASREATTRDPT
jgi:gamma-glutamyltranspeptidase